MKELTVMWYDRKKGQGILLDNNMNEYYIDDSTLGMFEIFRHDLVKCHVDKIDNNTLNVVKSVDNVYHGYSRLLRK